jgi:hypothetical protein
MRSLQKQPDIRDYTIVVAGQVEQDWGPWLTVTVTAEGGTTSLTLTGADQAALRGLLSRLWDLNLSVLSVNPASV